jgi:hypothetical protein
MKKFIFRSYVCCSPLLISILSEVCLGRFLVLQIRFPFFCSYLLRSGFSVPYFPPGCPLDSSPMSRRLPSVSEFCFSGGLSSELCAHGFGYRAVSSTRSVSVPAGVGPKASFFRLVRLAKGFARTVHRHLVFPLPRVACC